MHVRSASDVSIVFLCHMHIPLFYLRACNTLRIHYVHHKTHQKINLKEEIKIKRN